MKLFKKWRHHALLFNTDFKILFRILTALFQVNKYIIDFDIEQTCKGSLFLRLYRHVEARTVMIQFYRNLILKL